MLDFSLAAGNVLGCSFWPFVSIGLGLTVRTLNHVLAVGIIFWMDLIFWWLCWSVLCSVCIYSIFYIGWE